ncbi:MAG TPA: SLC13 family permease [Chitinophagales bacterium]|nr:SLC13 family permease [Chitinophagales bacterium]HRG84197.1 SLC13 family permease [Chitinophagales bacterium]HRH53360.1 SLC13 family permease [Chitinophagales bacterium]
MWPLDDITIVLLIVGFTLFMFIWEKIAIDITSLIAMALLMLTGVLTTKEGIAGFSNDATVTILFLFLLSAGLEKTGAVNLVGKAMIKYIGKNQKMAFIAVILVCGLISAFLNNTAVVIIFMPIVFKIAKFTNQSPSKLLMPLSFAAIMGGTLTLIGSSTNLVVNGVVVEHGYEPFGMFEVTPTGLILFVTFFLYMYFIGIKLIPARRSADSLTEDYELKDFLTEIIIEPGSPFLGKRIFDTPLVTELSLEVVEISDAKGTLWLPDDYELLEENDTVLVRGSASDIMQLKQMQGVTFKQTFDVDDIDLKSNETALVEVVIGPNSSLARSTFKEIDFRDLYEAIPLAVRRQGEIIEGRLDEIELRFGDDLLLEIKKDSFDQLKRGGDFVFTQEIEKEIIDKQKVWITSGILLMVILTSAFEILPIIQGAIIGTILMFLFKCITIREAYREVDWRIIFVLAALLPLGTALEKTGAAEMLAGYMETYISGYGPFITLFVLFAVTSVITSLMSNQATAALLSPIAISLGVQMGIDPKPLLFAVMFAASTCYLTPLGYQTNIMIYGPGNYKFVDFIKVGGLLSLISGIVVSLCLYYFYF